MIEGDSQPREIECSERIREMAAGKGHLLVLSEDGLVYAGALSECGNTFGQLGNGLIEMAREDERKDERPKAAKIPEKPTKRPDLWEIFTKGERFSFAEDSSRQSSAPPASVKILPKFSLDSVALPERAVQVACGEEHSLVLGESGTVYAFGSNQHLQLGLGEYRKDRAVVPSPVKVPLEEGTKVYSIAAGGHTSFFAAVKNSNEIASPAQSPASPSSILLACGEGTSGQLGNNQWPHVVGNTVRVPKLSGLSWFDEATNRPKPLQVRQMSVGGDGHVALVMGTFHPDRQPARHLGDLTHGYDLYLWGQNRFGQLGTGRIGNQAEPQSPIPAETASDQFFLSFAAESGQFNESNTLAVEGGQLQILPDLSHPELVPVQRIYCGPNVTFIY